MSAPTACGEHTGQTHYTAATLLARPPTNGYNESPWPQHYPGLITTTPLGFFSQRTTCRFDCKPFGAPGERCINSMIPLRQVPWCNFNYMGRAAKLGIMATKKKALAVPRKAQPSAGTSLNCTGVNVEMLSTKISDISTTKITPEV